MRPGIGVKAFSDVEKGDWYYDSVSIACEYGLISGYGNGKFGPNDKITREQAMCIIAKAMGLTGLEVKVGEKETDKLLAEYVDSQQIALGAKEKIASCVKAGIITGKSDKQLAPKAYITRAEVAVAVRKLLQKSNLI